MHKGEKMKPMVKATLLVPGPMCPPKELYAKVGKKTGFTLREVEQVVTEMVAQIKDMTAQGRGVRIPGFALFAGEHRRLVVPKSYYPVLYNMTTKTTYMANPLGPDKLQPMVHILPGWKAHVEMHSKGKFVHPEREQREKEWLEKGMVTQAQIDARHVEPGFEPRHMEMEEFRELSTARRQAWLEAQGEPAQQDDWME